MIVNPKFHMFIPLPIETYKDLCVIFLEKRANVFIFLLSI